MSLSAQAASLLPQPDQWIPVNDSVMGGVSISEYRTSPDGDHRFSGRVSLENNGGFASVRSLVKLTPPFGNARLHLRVRGDGKRYQLRLRTDRGFDGVAYASAFTTQAGEVTTVSLGLGSFAPTWRGRQVRGAPPPELGRRESTQSHDQR